jgi:hypothetical protein
VDGETLQRAVVENVEAGAIVMTDEHRGYTGLGSTYRHRSVNHSAGEYVRWFYIHINNLEGAWSHFKRQVIGVHHWMSEAHLQAYLDEFAWRWNRRDMGEGPRVNALLAGTAGRLTYKELIA